MYGGESFLYEAKLLNPKADSINHSVPWFSYREINEDESHYLGGGARGARLGRRRALGSTVATMRIAFLHKFIKAWQTQKHETRPHAIFQSLARMSL